MLLQLWTKCPVKVEMGHGDGPAKVTIPDKKYARQWSYERFDFNRKYGALLLNLKTEFVILFTTLDPKTELNWLANTFKNGFAFQYPFEEPRYANEKANSPQLHIYPLIMAPWFQKACRQEKTEQDPVMFMDGKVVQWTKDVCFNCQHVLERSVRQCSAFHSSCLKPLVDEKNLPSKEWIEAHATVADNIEGYTYRPIKNMALVEPFEPFTIYSLTTDEAKVKELRDKRSEAATTAAQSRFVQDVACKNCLRESCCGGFRRGGSYCKGLNLPEDYDYIHEKCEPWMAHVMMLTKCDPIDAKQIQSWEHARSPAKVLYPAIGTPYMDPAWHGKYKHDHRIVVMMRDCNGNPTMRMPYPHACKLMNVQPVSKWNELPPSCQTSRSLRAIAYGLASGRIHYTSYVKCGWGSRSLEVIEVRFEPGKFAELIYDNNRRNSRSSYKISEGDSFYDDLLCLPGLNYENGAAFSEKRQIENSVFHNAVIERRFNVTVEEVREACRRFRAHTRDVDTHEPALYDWLQERSKERCRQKRRSSKQPATSTAGENSTTT